MVTKNILKIATISFLATACSTQLSSAGDLDDLKAQMKAMEDRHQKEIQSLKQQFEKLLHRKEAPPVTVSQDESPEELTERIEELEEGLEDILTAQDEKEKEDNRTKINLYATVEFESFQNSNSVFDAKNVELFITSSLTDRLNFGAEIEFERTAKTSGGNRAGEVEVEQGWLEYIINESFKPRAGVILVPFGKYNLRHFDANRDLSARPIIERRIIPTGWAEAGLGFTGTSILSNTQIEYQFFVFNGLTDMITDRGLRSARGAFGSDNNANKAMAGQITVRPNRFIELGLSGYRGDYDAYGNGITGINVDWMINYKQFEFLGEYVHFDLENGLNSSGESVPEFMKGFYVQSNYHFWPQALNDTFLGHGFLSPTFTAVLRYGEGTVGDDGDVGLGDNKERRFTIGFNYRPVETFAFKFEYQINSTAFEKLERGNADGFLASISGSF